MKSMVTMDRKEVFGVSRGCIESDENTEASASPWSELAISACGSEFIDLEW